MFKVCPHSAVTSPRACVCHIWRLGDDRRIMPNAYVPCRLSLLLPICRSLSLEKFRAEINVVNTQSSNETFIFQPRIASEYLSVCGKCKYKEEKSMPMLFILLLCSGEIVCVFFVRLKFLFLFRWKCVHQFLRTRKTFKSNRGLICNRSSLSNEVSAEICRWETPNVWRLEKQN